MRHTPEERAGGRSQMRGGKGGESRGGERGRRGEERELDGRGGERGGVHCCISLHR